MPDAWEKTHGLDPKHDDSAKTMPSGYTAIEEYVNAVAERLIQ
jgi:pectate lyase